jgi:hypothetical protein
MQGNSDNCASAIFVAVLIFLLILQVFILESRTDKIKWNCGDRGVLRGTISGKPKDP